MSSVKILRLILTRWDSNNLFGRIVKKTANNTAGACFLDGNKIAKTLEEKLITELLFSTPKKICLIVFGGNAATEQFVNMKSRVAERVGIAVDIKKYPDIKKTDDAVVLVKALGETDYDGIVVQLPLTAGLDTQTILDAVPPLKDIDILGTVAKESYVKGRIDRTPPVAQAVRELLDSCAVNIHDSNIVVVGRGRLVGEPVHLMLERMKVAHDMVDIDTNEKEKLTLLKNANIIISGIGVSHHIKPHMVKKGVVIIDAGTSEQGGKLVGDVDPACRDVASFISPVPGGVGPITIVNLLRNIS